MWPASYPAPQAARIGVRRDRGVAPPGTDSPPGWLTGNVGPAGGYCGPVCGTESTRPSAGSMGPGAPRWAGKPAGARGTDGSTRRSRRSRARPPVRILVQALEHDGPQGWRQAAFRRRLDDAGRDERLDLVNGVEFTGQPLQDVGVDGRPQHLDRHALFPRVRAAAQVDDALASLAEPSEQLETAQAHGIARLQWFGRHRYSPRWLGSYDNAAVIRIAPQRGRRIRISDAGSE
jgi:hypothetical protein